MNVFGYEPSLQIAISNNPEFPDQEVAAALYGGEDLELDEWQSYYAKFYTGQVPSNIIKSPYIIKEIMPGLVELNFRNFVGMSRIGALCLVVRNRKISNQLYQAMLGELAQHYASLVFSFGTPVGLNYNKRKPGRDSEFVQYLFLSRFLLEQSPDIEAMGNIMAYDPHRKFEADIKDCAIDQSDNVTSSMIPYLLGGQMIELANEHSLTQSSLGQAIYAATGRKLYPTKGIRELKYVTVDTHENRFVKSFLEAILGNVESLEDILSGQNDSYFNPEIAENLELLHRKITRTLSHNMWQDVGKMQFIPFNSQVLQKKDGYRQLFSLYSLLQLATHCDFLETDFKNLIETKDVPTLYEYWCFFQVKTVMDSFSNVLSISRIINDSPIDHKLTAGLQLKYESGVTLYFNRTYEGSTGLGNTKADVAAWPTYGPSYSHNFRPDIILETGTRKLVFDAKYKGKRSGFYGEEEDGSIRSWKDEDLDKMHCYRDAISGVEGSFILYPGISSVVFPAPDSKALNNGVGALALRPDSKHQQKDNANSFLHEVIFSFLEYGAAGIT